VERSYFGPWTLRDSACGAADNVATRSAGRWAGHSVGGASPEAWVHLGQWKEAENASIDFYSFPRSDYYQTRRAELR
jgi:phospholipid-binding lipoprotein MlaA